MRYPTALTIAGSDSSGGAGVQADIKTMSALGCYAASAITAVTVQNTMGVTAVHAVPPEVVAGQIKAVMDDIKPTAVKVGMVNDTDTIHAIAHTIKPYLMEHGGGLRHLVVDPVMVATSGSRLMRDDALQCFCRKLLPLATLLTPNVLEAEVLANMRLTSDDEMDKAALRILNLGCTLREKRKTGSICLHNLIRPSSLSRKTLPPAIRMEQDVRSLRPSPHGWHRERK